MDFKKFFQAHKAEFTSAGVGLLFAVGDALIALADSGQHVSLAVAVYTGVGAGFIFLKGLYHKKRAELAAQALIDATNPVQGQDPAEDAEGSK